MHFLLFLAKFWGQKRSKWSKNIFSSFLSKELSNDIQHKCVLAKTQDFKISVILELFYPFWPIFRPKKGKMTRKYFFRNSGAILHPTRGHMPMFWKFQFFGPKTGRRARIPENRNFREKSVSVIFLQISSPNFMPKIRKILRAVFW